MTQTYEHLGVYSDWVSVARRRKDLFPIAPAGAQTQQRLLDVLGFQAEREEPQDVRTERRWVHDGLMGEEVSWSVGYGPRTSAWVLRPPAAAGALPGIVTLHDHGSFKYYGKEKIADDQSGPVAALAEFRAGLYDGRAFANRLAHEGFVVLVHDAFLWGSRRFPFEIMPEMERQISATFASWWFEAGTIPDDVAQYNAAAELHENLIEKYCALLGTSLAGVVSYEDRVAANYLRSRSDVLGDRLGCIGLSGGGARSALLQATCNHITAAVVVAMMGSYGQLLDHNVTTHTWMLFPHGWSRYGDWPDVAACRAPSPLLVQYALDDALFTVDAIYAAHERIAAHYAATHRPEAYAGEFYAGPHRFDSAMQRAAFGWLARQMKA